MKKKEIIKNRLEFTKIIKTCKYQKNDFFIIYYRKNNATNRYGISIPKKTGKAHIRNKIKRQIKSIIDNNKNNIQNSYDYVIIIRKKLLELKYKEMEEKFLILTKKIGDKNEEKN